MDKRYKDTDLREALHRKYSDTTQLPSDFMAKMERRLDNRSSVSGGSTAGPDGKTAGNKRRPLWRWVAVAACFLMIIGIGLYYQFEEPVVTSDVTLGNTARYLRQQAPLPNVTPEPTFESVLAAKPSKPLKPIPSLSPVRTRRTESPLPTDKEFFSQGKKYGIAIAPNGKTAASNDPNLHYASVAAVDDTVKYQAPSRVDDFIAKLADYHKVEPVVLDCSGEARDTSIVGTAYLFDDTRELDLFGRLLQVACCYDTKTSGYLLNFSHQQFFFCLKDLQKQEKYLWIAERINGQRILLFSTRSPIEAEVSSACFQVYREQLTHTNIKTLQF